MCSYSFICSTLIIKKNIQYYFLKKKKSYIETFIKTDLQGKKKNRDKIHVSIKLFRQWQHVSHLILPKNMRVMLSGDQQSH